MITGIAPQDKDDSQELANAAWKSALATAVRDPRELLALLNLNEKKYLDKISVNEKFKLLVPLSYVAKMKKSDWHDPLLRQVLPLKDEAIKAFGFLSDPVGDLNAEVSSGVLQKYHGRVLLITTGACAVHCRYCFRRHFPYANSVPDKAQWQQTLASIKSDKTVTEVILSGGDPLMLSDERLRSMCQDLATIPHITTLRFHTRVPLFLPERVTAYFIQWLSELKVKVVMVLHANHANELDSEFASIMRKFSQCGVVLLNQSVLLKNINDDADNLVLLSQRLFECGILPYYLHQLDKVQGAAHFEVSNDKVQRLQQQLRERLPGYLVPRFVKEVSGKRYKQPLE